MTEVQTAPMGDGQDAASITRAIAGISRIVEVTLEEQGLTIQKYRALTFLADGPATPSDLAYRLTVRPPTVSKLIHALVERGLMARTSDHEDRRSAVLTLTADGRRAISSADAVINERIDLVISELGADRRSVAEDGLQAMAVAMRRYWLRTHPADRR